MADKIFVRRASANRAGKKTPKRIAVAFATYSRENEAKEKTKKKDRKLNVKRISAEAMRKRKGETASVKTEEKQEKESCLNEQIFTVAFVSYNQMQKLYDGIDSVIRQNYKRIQLVIVDDCSCDFDADQLKTYIDSEKGENIVQVDLLRMEEHKGPAAAYQKALDMAIGEYVLFLGGDDRLANENNILDDIFRQFKKTNIPFIQCQATQVRNYAGVQEPNRSVFEMLKKGKAIDILIHAATSNVEHYICLQAMPMQTKALRRLGGFASMYANAFDWDLLLRILQTDISPFAVYDRIVTVKADSGTYHNESVGTVYLRENRIKEIEEILAGMYLPIITRTGKQAAINHCNQTIQNWENIRVGQFHWYHLSFREKLAWKKARRMR